MWIFNQSGFYSVVQKLEDVPNNTLTVRARCLADMLVFCEDCGLDPKVIDHTSGTDYEFRVRVPRATFRSWLADHADVINYPNFKNKIHRTHGPARAAIYSNVWFELRKITRSNIS